MNLSAQLAVRATGVAVAASLCMLLVYAAGVFAQGRVAERLAVDARHRVEIYAQSLTGVIERFAYLPVVATLDGKVQGLLAAPADRSLTLEVNRYLESMNRAAGGTVLFLLDAGGKTIAASNWNTAQSYIGFDFSFRPYFQQARRGEIGRFYAIGTLTGVPGYFIAAPVVSGNTVTGVVVTKILLDLVETAWRDAADQVLIADRHGIVFLASDPALKFRTVRRLDTAAIADLAETRQYGRDNYDLLRLGTASTIGGHHVLYRSDVSPGGGVIAEERVLAPYGWKLMLFADASSIEIAGNSARIAAILLIGVLGFFGLYWLQRTRRVREQLAAQAELEAAHRELEIKVEHRTSDLRAVNQALATEINERRRTERHLRTTQDELVQAAKMAALGQMAAGITHEINQPLTALGELADNARIYLQQGRGAEAASNLGHISALVYRLGKITSQLRAFARKSDSQPMAVDLRTVVAESLAILGPRIGAAHVDVATDIEPKNLTVLFEPVQLSQILINLVGNAFDSVKEVPAPKVILRGRREGAHVVLTIEDNGAGLDGTAMANIFEPFFTTKPAGQGLGLGLPISLAIARDFKSSLTARNVAGGGAAFDLIMVAHE